MIPPRYAPILFGLILSGLMSLLVSGIATVRAVGLSDGVLALWLGNWLSSWAIAFPAVLIVAPLARRLVARMTRDG
ncbi:DUF2798 domain-containing protein [Jannaschia formosa]|uniref:DUF2798 domain-containing protein n=1 Tax=Jannaschia formosa TaxID=2259592 RepID=UPI000E1BB8F8|nr:DUF2798 domain-containing protein [Jannaschia formosa]TFL17702.1 DUF2798 domain-containing protein [Jannaschia formosa]